MEVLFFARAFLTATSFKEIEPIIMYIWLVQLSIYKDVEVFFYWGVGGQVSNVFSTFSKNKECTAELVVESWISYKSIF